MENSKIAWTDHTFNPWVGCTKVGPGCLNCYAKTRDGRHLHSTLDHWGPGAPRELASEAIWQGPIKWNRRAAANGYRARVFCASMADVFDKEAPKGARERLWELIRSTPHLDWLLLTKRPERIRACLPQDWGADGYPNVWLGVSCEDSKHGFPRVDLLRAIPARVRFVSCEPLLEDISKIDLTDIHWLIVGGESFQKARTFDVAWARALRDVCTSDGVTFFMKQLGARPIAGGLPVEMLHVTAKGKRDAAGTCLENFPADLRIQQFPVRGSVVTRFQDADLLPLGEIMATVDWLECIEEDDSAFSHLAQSAHASLTGLIKVLEKMGEEQD